VCVHLALLALRNGTAVGPFDKNSKVQADNLYWLSMLAGSKIPVIAESSLKDAADDTYSFLVSNMRRPDGLFVWMTNQQGEQISQPGSHIFSQWMVIAALARYGLAFQNKTAVEMALQTFKAVDNKFYNSSWGGYDVGKSDYLPFKALPGTNNVAPIPFNAFMQGVVAMGELYRAVQDPSVQQRLLEAVDRLCNRMPVPVTTAITNTTKHSTARGTVLSNSLISKAEQTTTQEAAPGSSSPSSSSSSTTTTPLRFAMNYDLRWSPAVVGDTSTSNGLNDSAVDYAHVLGHLWRALDVLQLLSAEGALPAADRNACQQRLAEIGAWSLDSAYDRQNNTGGIMYSGYVGQPPAKTMKVGWAQTESLMTMFYVWQIIGDRKYLQMLEGNLRFIYHSMLRNPASGELFYQVDRDGKLMEGDVRAGLPMAQIWKDAFHTIRPYVRLHTALQGSLGYIPGQV